MEEPGDLDGSLLCFPVALVPVLGLAQLGVHRISDVELGVHHLPAGFSGHVLFKVHSLPDVELVLTEYLQGIC